MFRPASPPSTMTGCARRWRGSAKASWLPAGDENLIGFHLAAASSGRDIGPILQYVGAIGCAALAFIGLFVAKSGKYRVIRMNLVYHRRSLLKNLGAFAALSVLAACSDSGDSGKSAAAAPPAQGSADLDRLLADNPLPEMVLGREDAPVTIIEYASMTCPHCASFHNNTFPAIKEKYVDSGKVRFIFREFGFDPRAEAGFMLARCAGERYFPMVEVLFKQQDSWARAENGRQALLSIARLAGFSQEAFEACLTDQQLLDNIRAVKARGESFGVEATPTFFINGRKYSGALSVDQMSAIIDSL